ncbi:outer membrane lipoprotein-sorting protein [Aurantivibrio plasticivorans]
MRLSQRAFCTFFILLYSSLAVCDGSLDARKIIKGALDQWRGLSSYSEMAMIIHRPDWERKMVMRGWTKGEKKSLVRVVEPVKDAGSGTLLLKNEMWTYSPKVNRPIKLPGSMMNQSWMGSDFTNNDIARSDDILDDYEHSLLKTELRDGHQVYVIESIPHEDAAVVWGRELITIRDDFVMLQHDLFDQDGVLVKSMVTTEIKELGGRTVASIQRMTNIEEPEKWTEMQVYAAEFNIELSDRLFTQSNLMNPRH